MIEGSFLDWNKVEEEARLCLCEGHCAVVILELLGGCYQYIVPDGRCEGLN